MKQILGVLAVLAAVGTLVVRLVSTAASGPVTTGPLSTALVVMAPELTSLVQVSYTGVAGDCAGKSYDQGPVPVPAGAAVRIEPGPKGAAILPAGCIAAARVMAIRGAVVVQASLEDDRAAGGTLSPVAAYLAPPVARSATEVSTPRFGRGLEEGSSLIVAVNLGGQTANVTLELVDEKGNPLSPARCPECSQTVPADGAALWDASTIKGLPEGMPFAAFAAADQPMAAAVAAVPEAGLDLALQAAIPVGEKPLAGYLPNAMVGNPSNAPLDSWLELQNQDRQSVAQAFLELRKSGENPVDLQLAPLPARATARLFLPDLAALAPGAWSAVVLSDRPLASQVRLLWRGRGPHPGHGAYTAPEMGADLLVPQFVQTDGILSVRNTDAQSRAPVGLDVLPLGDAKPVFSTVVVIPPGATEHLRLPALAPGGEVPAGFVGSLRLRGQVPLAVAALLPSGDNESVAYLEGAAADRAAGDVAVPLVFSGWGPEQPPPTPTATDVPRATDTPTATASSTATPTTTDEPKITATPTATARVSDTPTATRPGQPSATPTAPATRPAKSRQWTRFTPANSALPGDAVKHVEDQGDAGLWLRVPQGGRRPDKVVRILANQPWQVYDGQRPAVEANLDLVRRQGTLRDFWAVDEEPPVAQRRVWVGPSFYDGVRWTAVAQDETQPGGGTFRHEQRAILDPLGQAAVPFQVELDCQNALPCGESGLRGYPAAGPPAYDLRFAPSTDAGEYGLETLHLVPGARQGTFVMASGAARASRAPRAAAPAQAGQAYAVSQAALYVLPGPEPIEYPFLESDVPLRNAGYASAAALAPDGRLVVFTWVELHAPPPARDVAYRVFANTWTGSAWDTEDLTASPLFHGDARYDRITAAAYCSGTDGALWLTTYAGAVAARHADNTWEVAAPAGDAQFAGIVDTACDGEGTLWMATESGLLQGTVGIARPVYAPFTQKP